MTARVVERLPTCIDREIHAVSPDPMSEAFRVDPMSDDRDAAGDAFEATLITDAARAQLRLRNGSTVVVSEPLLQALQASAGELVDARSDTVKLSDVALSPAHSAELLGLSRPFVARLLDDGVIPSRPFPAGGHRTVQLSDVLAFHDRRLQMRSGRRRIMEIVEKSGMGY